MDEKLLRFRAPDTLVSEEGVAYCSSLLRSGRWNDVVILALCQYAPAGLALGWNFRDWENTPRHLEWGMRYAVCDCPTKYASCAPGKDGTLSSWHHGFSCASRLDCPREWIDRLGLKLNYDQQVEVTQALKERISDFSLAMVDNLSYWDKRIRRSPYRRFPDPWLSLDNWARAIRDIKHDRVLFRQIIQDTPISSILEG